MSSPATESITPALSLAAQETPAEKPRPIVRAAPAPAEMERLSFLVGTWINTAIFFDREGNEVGSFNAATDLPGGDAGISIEWALGGWVLESGAGTPYGRAWYRYDPLGKRYMMAAADFRGNFDILAGDFEGDELVFAEVAPRPHQDGGTIQWRWIFYDMQSDSYRLRQTYSRDGGATWVLANRQLNRRAR